MNLSRWGIQYPLPSVLLFVVLVIAGFWGLRQLPISQLPDIALPTIQVSVGLPGASPSTLETYVAMARATADRAVLDGRLLPIRAAKLVGILDEYIDERPGLKPLRYVTQIHMAVDLGRIGLRATGRAD